MTFKNIVWPRSIFDECIGFVFLYSASLLMVYELIVLSEGIKRFKEVAATIAEWIVSPVESIRPSVAPVFYFVCVFSIISSAYVMKKFLPISQQDLGEGMVASVLIGGQ